MNIERLVADRLHRDAAGRAPDGLLAMTLDKVAVTPQQRVLWPRRTQVASRRRPGRPLFALAATLVGLGLLGALIVAGGGNPTRTPLPTVTATDMPPLIGVSLSAAVGPLPAGRYYTDAQLVRFWPPDSAAPSPDLLPIDAKAGLFTGPMARVTFDLPQGWSWDGSTAHKEGPTVAGGLSLRLGAINHVFSDPCHWSGGSSVDDASLHSVEGVGRALTSWWPTATGPTPATIGGLAGQYVEVGVPAKVDMGSCDNSQYVWYELTESGTDPAAGGELARIWVVDADGAGSDLLGGVMVVDARSRLGTSAADLAELQAVVNSIVIEPLPLAAIAQAGPPRPLPASGPLDPANYFMANPCTGACPAYTGIVFNVPVGWATGDGYVYKNLGLASEVGFAAWAIGAVYTDSCHWRDSPTKPIANFHAQDSDPFHLGGNPDLLDQFHSAEATRVMLGATLTLKLEQTVPAGLDISTCDDGEYRTWTAVGGQVTANAHHAAGQKDSIYLVDLDRRPLVIDAWQGPLASAKDVAELQELIDTLLIR